MSVYYLDGKIITDTISPDEGCWGLLEADRVVMQGDGSSAWHRVQDVFVVRKQDFKEVIASYQTDLGLVDNFKGVPPVGMLSFGDDTVGEFMAEAERSRNDPYWANLGKDLLASSQLIPMFLQEKEENWERIANKSVFGPAYNKQRNGFPTQEVHKQALARGREAS